MTTSMDESVSQVLLHDPAPLTKERLQRLISVVGGTRVYQDLPADHLQRFATNIGLRSLESEEAFAVLCTQIGDARRAANLGENNAWIPVSDGYARYLTGTVMELDDLAQHLRAHTLRAWSSVAGAGWWRGATLPQQNAFIDQVVGDCCENPGSALHAAAVTALTNLTADGCTCDHAGEVWWRSYRSRPERRAHPASVGIPVAAGWMDRRFLIPAITAFLTPCEPTGDAISALARHLARLITAHADENVAAYQSVLLGRSLIMTTTGSMDERAAGARLAAAVTALVW